VGTPGQFGDFPDIPLEDVVRLKVVFHTVPPIKDNGA